ncbi:hypothetical protein C9J22_12970 [Photobacterium phosphoreum]|uniref:DUF6602 domain-containing protein n=1 Tax=Photobacterium phosphoreum TaxID=659 RepID=UPI000D150E90|nr:DUF6602 domain-containing protein [Photobacterium phosphoreum]PSU69785.1 hypothetical protein C9J22_12970 [Photobacterium phosphoreum]
MVNKSIKNNLYQELLRAKIKGAIEEAKAASAISHNGLKGTVLEILISKLFKPLLPSDISIGTGQILDQYTNKLSNQIDIILYDKSILPPILFDGITGIFPIESVLYVIEVKTTLSKKEITNAHKSAKALRNFNYLPGMKNHLGNDKNHEIEPIVNAIFALKSDLSSDEAKRYVNVYSGEKPYLSHICVAEKGYWFNNGYHWYNVDTVDDYDDYDEILSFIGRIMNSYKDIATSRRTPKLGNYIIPKNSLIKGMKSRNLPLFEFTCESCSIVTKDIISYRLHDLEKTLSSHLEDGVRIEDDKELEIIGSISVNCSFCGHNQKSKDGTFKFHRVFENYDLIKFKFQ